MSDNQKLSINVALQEPALSICEQINREVVRITESPIVFGVDATSVPHITIVMGHVTRESRSQLELETEHLARRMPPATLTFGPPYRERVTGRYVFSDVTGPAEFLVWRSHVRERVSHLFVEGARTTDEPHVTLAHVEDEYPAVDALLAKAAVPLPCDMARVDLTISGAKGRRLDVLRSFALGSTR